MTVPARAGARSLRRQGRRTGMTLLELVLGIALMGTFALIVASIFRTATVSARRTASQADRLSQARKALHGDGSFPGIVFGVAASSSSWSVASSTLAVVSASAKVSTYTVTSSGELLYASAAGASSKARSLGPLALAYFGVDPQFRVVETTAPADVRLVTCSFEAVRAGRNLRFYSGAALRNRE